MSNDLSRAFAALRKNGIVAKANFSCCGTCGHYKMGDTQNYVFYSVQSKGDFTKYGDVYLQWKGDGAKIVSILEQFVDVDWNGNENSAILVKQK